MNSANAFGKTSPIDGMPANAHLIGVPDEAIELFAAKEGGKVIIELWSINGRRAYHFSVDDQIAYMCHVFDRLFLGSFPHNRAKFSHLFTPEPVPKGAPRARACLLVAHGLHMQQEHIVRSARFWTAAGANFTAYGMHEARSTYTTSFGGIRCDDEKEMKVVVKETMKKAPSLRDMIANKMDEQDPAAIADILEYLADHRTRLDMRKVRPAGQSAEVIQWSVYVDVTGIIADEHRAAFDAAMRRIVFNHWEHGMSSYFVWDCKMCHAVSHEEAACDVHVHLKWPLLREQQGGARGAATNNNQNRRGNFPPPRH